MHSSIDCYFKKARRQARIDSQQFCTKKAKSAPGFEPGLLGQNATALVLAQTPQPTVLGLGSALLMTWMLLKALVCVEKK